jgi:hypothetical protein
MAYWKITAYSAQLNEHQLELNLDGERSIQTEHEARQHAQGLASRLNAAGHAQARDWVGRWELV